MTPPAQVKPGRERILDAAARVMRERGVANTTTKLIAAEAGYSEAMLYKHFDDKQDLFLAVLAERSPEVSIEIEAAGRGDLSENITSIVEQLMAFFRQTFPIAASIFNSPELLAEHREGVSARDRGPHRPILAVRAYLDAELTAGRLPAHADTLAAAQLLVGSAFHQGFLAAFNGTEGVPHARGVASGIAEVVVGGLLAPQR